MILKDFGRFEMAPAYRCKLPPTGQIKMIQMKIGRTGSSVPWLALAGAAITSAATGAWSQKSPAAAPIPTFAHDIAPIIYGHCSTCHRPGESGPFSLLNYEDARKHARKIAAATSNRIMPPWLPAPGYGDFANNPRLSAEEIRLISEWVK